MSEQQIASRWPSLSGQQTFIDLMRAFEEYARSFRPMWPFFWLKAAAVKLDGTWRLVVFSLSGQWNDDRQAAPVDPPLGALALVSKRLDATSAWKMVESIVATKTVEIAAGIVAAVPEVLISTSVKWQETYPYVPELAADVAEPVTWWYLYTADQRSWTNDPAQQTQVDTAIKPTLEYLSEDSFQSFISKRFAPQRPPQGGFLSIGNFTYHLDLPLALRVTVSAYKAGDAERRIEVDCHAPLRLSELAITQGDIPLPAEQAVSIEEDTSSEGGWAVSHASIVATTSKLRIASPQQLGRILWYEFSVPTIPEMVADVVARLYAPHDPAGKGAEKWARELLTGTGPAFEVALLNALARLGIPVLFGGQVTTPEGQTAGTATPGIDLVALDYRNRRAVAISAKGTPKLPQREHLETLRQAVNGLSLVLPDWVVFGLVVCHAPQGDLAIWNKPTDLNVWGQAELECLYQSSTENAVAGLLWMSPLASEAERQLYQMLM